MPKNKKKSKNKSNRHAERQLIYKDEEQDYGLVIKTLGNKRFLVKLETTKRECVAKLRGNIHKNDWVNTNDLVLVSLRDFQTDKVDIVHHYMQDEFKYFIKQGIVDFEDDKNKNSDTEAIVFDYNEIDEI